MSEESTKLPTDPEKIIALLKPTRVENKAFEVTTDYLHNQYEIMGILIRRLVQDRNRDPKVILTIAMAAVQARHSIYETAMRLMARQESYDLLSGLVATPRTAANPFMGMSEESLIALRDLLLKQEHMQQSPKPGDSRPA